MDFPLVQIHPLAFKAHEAAHCAGDQGKYWEMHDRLFANQKTLKPKDLARHAETLELDSSSFESCLKSGKHAAEIRKDLQAGGKAGIRGTPSFLLGLTQPGKSTIRATKIIRGAQPYSRFKPIIDELLGAKAK